MRFAAVCLIAFIPLAAQAALPPMYQNNKDLDVLVDWVKSHHRVVESLKMIDFQTLTVHFDEDCIAYFKREPVKNQMPGPAPPLRFDHATCPVE